jgi:LPS-assembly lipoprotein
LSDTTAGFVTVTASYILIDTDNQKRIASGSRKASAYFDRTSQIFANQRAVRDAENRAGREVAEKLRFAIASDLRR